MRLLRSRGWLFGLGALALIACDSSVVDDGQPGGSGGAGASGPGSGGGGGDGTGGFAACVAAMQIIDASCDGAPPGTIEWIGYGAGACMGSSGNTDGWARLLMSLDAVDPEGNPTILGVRLEPEDGNAPQLGDRVEIALAPAQKVTSTAPLATQLGGSGTIEPMTFAGGLGFLFGETDDAVLSLETPVALHELTSGGTLRGTFHFVGGTFTKLDQNGEPVAALDPTAEVAGCFVVPFEMHPIELDD